tara:strand:- start:175 stop:462 length:288 start_codon:yes stop_codon:yes gene_type:complete
MALGETVPTHLNTLALRGNIWFARCWNGMAYPPRCHHVTPRNTMSLAILGEGILLRYKSKLLRALLRGAKGTPLRMYLGVYPLTKALAMRMHLSR